MGTLNTPSVWVTSAGAGRVIKLSLAGVPLATGVSGGDSQSAELNNQGHVFVVNRTQAYVSQFSEATAGLVRNINTPPQPRDGVCDTYGNFWVACKTGGEVIKYSITGSPLLTVVLGGSAGSTVLVRDSFNNILVSNKIAQNIVRLDQNGVIIGTFTPGPSPESMSIDFDNTLWVAHTSIASVTKLDNNGTPLFTTALVAQSAPTGIAVDPNGDAWVCEHKNNTVAKISSTGLLLGHYTVGIKPAGIAVDENGDIWVLNFSSNNVTKLNSVGTKLFTVSVPAGPRSFSDFTGYQAGVIHPTNPGPTRIFIGALLVIKDMGFFDGQLLVVGSEIPTFDGKLYIEDDASVLFNGAIQVSKTTEDTFDGFFRVSDSATATFDGELYIDDAATGLFNSILQVSETTVVSFNGALQVSETIEDMFDGFFRVSDSTMATFDGELYIDDATMDPFDGRLHISDATTALFNGEAWIRSSNPNPLYGVIYLYDDTQIAFDAVIELIDAATSLFDGAIYIDSASIEEFAGAIYVFDTKATPFNGKTTIQSTNTDAFNGSTWIRSSNPNIFVSTIKIIGVIEQLFNGQIATFSSGTAIFAGQLWTRSSNPNVYFGLVGIYDTTKASFDGVLKVSIGATSNADGALNIYSAVDSTFNGYVHIVETAIAPFDGVIDVRSAANSMFDGIFYVFDSGVDYVNGVVILTNAYIQDFSGQLLVYKPIGYFNGVVEVIEGFIEPFDGALAIVEVHMVNFNGALVVTGPLLIVDNVNGDDIAGFGTKISPFASIARAIEEADILNADGAGIAVINSGQKYFLNQSITPLTDNLVIWGIKSEQGLWPRIVTNQTMIHMITVSGPNRNIKLKGLHFVVTWQGEGTVSFIGGDDDAVKILDHCLFQVCTAEPYVDPFVVEGRNWRVVHCTMANTRGVSRTLSGGIIECEVRDSIFYQNYLQDIYVSAGLIVVNDYNLHYNRDLDHREFSEANVSVPSAIGPNSFARANNNFVDPMFAFLETEP